MEIIVRRVKNAHKLVGLVMMIFCLTSFSQDIYDEVRLSLSIEEYEVINAYYTNENQILKVYYKTQFDKGWSTYFNENDNLDLITKNRGLGTNVTDEELAKILSYEKRMNISSEIMNLKPIKLIQKKIKGITLVKSFDNPYDKNVVRISKPIIIDDLAVFRSTESLGSSINIMQRKSNKWELIYTICEWLILID